MKPATRLCPLLAPIAAIAAVGCATFPDDATTRASAESMVKHSFTAPQPQLLERLTQDRSQQICSRLDHAELSQADAAEVVKLARASFKYPAGGKLVGSWKEGERLAHDGAGDRIQNGVLEKRKENGGLCQNCHELAPGEINVGNIGPSLKNYGVQRGSSEEIAKFTYEKIYNAWAYFPCSNMPRLGASGHLKPEQIVHLVAYLIDPASPINKR